MRQTWILALTVFLLIGCNKPPVVTIPRKSHPPLAYVRILNLDKVEYSVGSKDRQLYGAVEPGNGSAFNYLAARYGPPFAVKPDGGHRKLGDNLQPGDVKTYVLFPDRVAELSDEPHAPKSNKFATVCFRTLNKATGLTIVDGSGKKTVFDTKQILVLDPGTYHVEPVKGAWAAQDLNLASDMSYSIIDVDSKKPLILMYNSPNQVYGRRI